MLTNIANDFMGALSAIGNADSGTQVVLFLIVFVALPYALTYIRDLIRPSRNIVGGDMVGGDKITYVDDELDEQDGYVYRFPRPSVTATVMLVHKASGEFFVGYRDDNADAYPGYACLPGGFLEAKVVDEDGDVEHKGERVEQTALREVLEECHVSLDEKDLFLIDVKSDPNTDPRAHVINVCYLAFVDDEQKEFAHAGDDLSGYDWRRLEDIDRETAYAFNHYEIILRGAKWAKASMVNDAVGEHLKEVKQ